MASDIRRATKTALLMRPAPLGAGRGDQTESVASYLFRLAMANGFARISSMLHELGVRGFMMSTADRGPAATSTVSLLEQLTLLPLSTLLTMTLREDIASMKGDPDDDGRPWILNAHRLPAKSTAALFSVCPSCLAEDDEPYWRRHWRLATSTVCATHHRRHIQSCPACGVQLGLAAGRLAALTDCDGCGASLLAAPPERAVARRAAWLGAVPAQATRRTFPVPLACAAQWWAGVRTLLYGLCFTKVADLLLSSAIGSEHKLTLQRCRALGRRDFCLYPLDVRHDLLCLLAYLLGDWPKRFARVMQGAGVTASRFSLAELPQPFWLDQVLSECLDASSYSPSPEEVRSAAAALQRQEGRGPSKIQLKRVLGVTEAQAIDDAVPTSSRRLSRNELLGVMWRLEKTVQAAPVGRDERSSWTRDACAIGLAAWLGLSFRTVVSMSLRQGRQLEIELGRQAALPGDRRPLIQLLHRWLVDYLTNIRPRFSGYEQTAAELFLTRFGEPYGGFGLAARFADLLRECNLACWPRGARLLVGAPLREEPEVERDELTVGNRVQQIKGSERSHIEGRRRDLC